MGSQPGGRGRGERSSVRLLSGLLLAWWLSTQAAAGPVIGKYVRCWANDFPGAAITDVASMPWDIANGLVGIRFLAVGFRRACVVTETYRLRCFGAFGPGVIPDPLGDMGVQISPDAKVPVSMATHHFCWIAAGQAMPDCTYYEQMENSLGTWLLVQWAGMWDRSHFMEADRRAGNKAFAVAVDGLYTCWLSSPTGAPPGNLVCSGKIEEIGFSFPSSKTIVRSEWRPCTLKPDDTLYCDESLFVPPAGMGPLKAVASSVPGVLTINATDDVTCMRTKADYPEVSCPSGLPKSRAVVADGFKTYCSASLADGGLRCWSRNGSAVAVPPEIRNVTALERSASPLLGMFLGGIICAVTWQDPWPNSPPTSPSLSYAANQDSNLTVSASAGLLSNTTDPMGRVVWPAVDDTVRMTYPMRVQSVSVPANGQITLLNASSGAFLYRPNPGFVGQDTFTFLIAGGKGAVSAPILVVIRVADVPEPPMVRPMSYTIPEDTSLVMSMYYGLLATTRDPDRGDVVRLASITRLPANGRLLSWSPSNGSFVYRPNANFAGQDTIGFLVADRWNLSAAGVATITVLPVNDPPVLVNSSATYTVRENGTLRTTATNGLLSFTTDPDPGDVLFVGTYRGGPSNGRITALSIPTGAFTYVPNATFYGTDGFVAEIVDGSNASVALQVVIHVEPAANVAPAVRHLTYKTPANVTLSVTAARGLLSTCEDLNVADACRLANATLRSPASGALSGLDLATGAFAYRPAPGFLGQAVIDFAVTDGKLATAATAMVDVARMCELIIRPASHTPTAGLILNLAEVQLYTQANTLVPRSALTFTLSSASNLTGVVLDAGFCNDGNTSVAVYSPPGSATPNRGGGQVCHSGPGDSWPALNIAFECSLAPYRAVVFNRADTQLVAERINAFMLEAQDTQGVVQARFQFAGGSASYSVPLVCLAGTGGQGCTPCSRGSFNADSRPSAAQSNCQPCPEGRSTAAAGASSAASCTVPICQAGRGGPSCSSCPRGQFSPGGTPADPQPPCRACPVGWSTPYTDHAAVEDCKVCAPGFGARNGSSASCVACGVGFWSAGGTTTASNSTPSCLACPSGSSTNTTGTAAAAGCNVCSPGRGAVGANPCAVCGRGSWSAGSNPALRAGVSCTPCPAGLTTFLNATTADSGPTSASACGVAVCAPGFGGPSCSQCSIGWYSPGGTTANPTPSCAFCGESTTTAQPGATSKDACQLCRPGFGKNASGVCTVCLPGTFSAGGTGGCTPCGAGTGTAVMGSTSSAACIAVCALGQGGMGCMPCATGSFSGGGNASAPTPTCTPCAAGRTTTGPGSTSADACSVRVCMVRIRPWQPAAMVLNLAEVQLFDRDGALVPRSALAFTLSSTFSFPGVPLSAGYCNDGATFTLVRRPVMLGSAGIYNTGAGQVCQTPLGDPNPTLSVTHNCSVVPSRVVVHNRQDGADMQSRILGFALDGVGENGTAYTTYIFQLPAANYSIPLVCPPGSGGPACSPCPVGMFAAPSSYASPQPNCTACPAGKTTSTAGATSSASCTVSICPPGSGGASCQQCWAGSWSAGGTQTNPRPPCLACEGGRTTLSAGATSSANCIWPYTDGLCRLFIRPASNLLPAGLILNLAEVQLYTQANTLVPRSALTFTLSSVYDLSGVLMVAGFCNDGNTSSAVYSPPGSTTPNRSGAGQCCATANSDPFATLAIAYDCSLRPSRAVVFNRVDNDPSRVRINSFRLIAVNASANVFASFNFSGALANYSVPLVGASSAAAAGAAAWPIFKLDLCTDKAVVCPAPAGPCQRAVACDPETGVCGPPTNETDGTPCPDGGTCVQGACVQGPASVAAVDAAASTTAAPEAAVPQALIIDANATALGANTTASDTSTDASTPP